MSSDPLQTLLPRLRREDGRLWLRIEAQTHPQYGEIPFRVLVRDREQILQALPFLQEALMPLRADADTDADTVTVAFMGLTPSATVSYGMFEGDAFFEPDAQDHLHDEPVEGPRRFGVFDAGYSDDAYAIQKRD